MILGVTGNIASGKSTVAQFFVDAGAGYLSADQLAREVVQPGGALLQQIVGRFGAIVLQADRQLDRARLADIIFADSSARRDLNAMLHPAIAELSEVRLKQLNGTGNNSLVIYESPLLFEAGAEERVDRILVVTVKPEVQLQRLMRRDGIDERSARSKIAAQMPQDEKVKRADYTLDNSGSLEDCRKQVMTLAELLYSQIPAR
jgi:dephospho-CoA kinase